ncbi:carboxy terminal-processing peptidase [Mucilaginibacter daejeonensis]|uniref:carboxy terminal-processing peptidase n=1 Tax=Mucilaginibacter daejeonensis TaxID=398049 RepID=UPI001D17C196|nr:carboxy terminal-processing peptidase [Mucilaginibacter daejeonensis]UEG53663.1 carboxy terminal-processing peptidase [Mucilaginibacter daejeonensis]
MFKRSYMFLVVGAALACQAATSPSKVVDGSNNLQPDQQQSLVLKEVASLISNYNYKKVPLNDSLSAVVYDRYLKALDENHNYLLATDIKDIERFRKGLDDDMKAGNLNNVFYIFNLYQKRYLERINYSLTQIDNKYDYNKNESFTYDREKEPWMANTTEMNKLWSQRVKYDLLNLKLASADVTKNKETLRKRYQNLISQSKKLSNQDVFQVYMDAFTESIDPHTNYFNPANAANFNIEMSRSLEGIGASLMSENEYVTIKTIVPGGPADKSKQINIDDRIIGVAQGKDGEFQDVVGWRLDNAIAIIRGTKGTVVRLKLLPKGVSASMKPKIVEMVREKIVLKDQLAKKEIRTYNSNGKTVKIGIINVPAFYIDFNAYRAKDPNYQSTTRDVKRILDTLKNMNVDGVVMDLRQNGGGSLIEAIELTGLFIKNGPVVQVRDTRNRVEVNEDEDPSVTYSGPMAVLTDRFSASASEIFAGAIQDYGRGLVIGTQTYGKGTVQSAIELDKVINPSLKEMITALAKKSSGTGAESKFGQLNLTVAKFYRISGSSTQHKGVMPDITFPSVIPLDKYGEDTEPSALPFDMIQKSNYTKVADLSSVIPQLTKLHEQRMASNANYKYMLEDIADYKKRAAETSVTLNEQDLKKQRDSEEQKTFERNNLRRQALGLAPLKKGQTRPKNEDLDFLKMEAGQILTDFVNMEKAARYTNNMAPSQP